MRAPSPLSFPPRPSTLRGRAGELATLARRIDPSHASHLAFVGQGGSGKSMLAAALGHRVRARFSGGIHWFRVGAWDAGTLGEMLAVRFGTTRDRKSLFRSLEGHMSARGPTLIVLDNHEDDRAMARFLDELRKPNVTWIITARRCLLAGVSMFPVTAPLVTSGRSAFPRVAALTDLLRHNPLALDIADALVRQRAISARHLERYLRDRGVDRIRAIKHEDDLPEVTLLVDWVWQKLGASARRLLTVLAHVDGDHTGRGSLFELARVPPSELDALRQLERFHLVQEPFANRFALHAVVKYALLPRASVDKRRIVTHFLTLLERQPTLFDLEQTHLFAAMDFAHASSTLGLVLRIERLLQRISDASLG